MYQYLKSIGLEKYKTKRAQADLIETVTRYPQRIHEMQNEYDQKIVCYEKDLGYGIGVAVIKTVDPDGYEAVDHFYPYVRGLNFLYHDSLEFEPYSDKEGMACICDENNIGIPMIFHVNNMIECRMELEHHKALNGIVLSGLAASGTILLPIERDVYDIALEERGNEIRNRMIDEAKAGNQEAMEQLTLDDIDTYTIVTRRSKREDLFTIVSSYFMPYTVECDKYSILADIIDVVETTNELTGEDLYYLSLDCNSIQIDISIAKSEMYGTPEKGRRFKGNIWLQGEVDVMKHKKISERM